MKRNFLSQVDTKNITLEIITSPTESQKKEIFQLFLDWCEMKHIATEEMKQEQIAIQKYFDCIDDDRYIIFLVYIENQLVLFSLSEMGEKNFVMSHFEKQLNMYPGISEYFLQQKSLFFQKKGCINFNIEQDLGIIGLRKNKELQRPVYMLEKYSITY